MYSKPSNEVGIRELRHDTRAFLDRVVAGERLIITDRGRPIAEIVPHVASQSVLERMLTEGRAIPARGKLQVAWRLDDPVSTWATEELEAMRNEDRVL